jgi:hypothetical protein
MVDDQKDFAETKGQAGQAPAPLGGFWRSLADIFVDPVKVFARIDAGLSWWKPFIVLSAVSMILGYLMLPFRRKLVEIGLQGRPAEQVQQTLSQTDKFGPVSLIAIPIVLVIILLILAGLAHVIINIMSTRSNYKKTLSLFGFCGLIGLLGQIIGTLVIMSRGVEGVESASDLMMSFSLAPLFPEVKGALAALMQSLGIFEIWYYVVVILGIAAVFKISRKLAIIAVIPAWLLTFLGVLLGNKFQGGSR